MVFTISKGQDNVRAEYSKGVLRIHTSFTIFSQHTFLRAIETDGRFRGKVFQIVDEGNHWIGIKDLQEESGADIIGKVEDAFAEAFPLESGEEYTKTGTVEP